ncbi:MAG: hypothetical protein ING29_10640 [Azospirillum sp.]|nr:hypothetical protein [Azospirillum sp.]
MRQIAAYRDLAPWRLSWTDPSVLAVEVRVLITNLLIYFHGPLPPLVQAWMLDAAEAAGLEPSMRLYAGTTGLLHVAATAMLYRVIRALGAGAAVAALLAGAFALAPLPLALARGFGTSWFVAAAFGQVALLLSAMGLRSGARFSRPIFAAVLTWLVLSDVLLVATLGSLVAAWLIADRGAWRAALSWWLVVPATAAALVTVYNLHVLATVASPHPQNFVLFFYPFVNYLIETLKVPEAGGVWTWYDRLRVVTFVVGPAGALAVLPALAQTIFAGFDWERPAPLRFAALWAAIAAIGFSALFLFYAGPGTGSQAMPTVGYPIYLVVPGFVLLACAIVELGRAAAPVAAVLLAANAIAGPLYVARSQIAGGFFYVAEGVDNVGFRQPGRDVTAVARAIEDELARVPPGTPAALALQVDANFLPARNVVLWLAGAIDGGRFERARSAISYVVDDVEGNRLESTRADGVWPRAEIERLCGRENCAVVGAYGAPLRAVERIGGFTLYRHSAAPGTAAAPPGGWPAAGYVEWRRVLAARNGRPSS